MKTLHRRRHTAANALFECLPDNCSNIVDRESSSHACEKGGQSKGGSFFWTKIDGRSDFEEDRLSFSNWGCESISTWHGPNGPVTSGGFFYSWESAVRHHQHSRTWEGPPLSYENESFCRFDKNTSGNHHCGAGMCQWSCCVNYSPPNPAQGVGANLSLPVDWLPGSYMPGGPFANNGTNSPGFSEQKSQNALDTAIQPANAIAVTMATTENMATTTQSDATPLPLHDEPGTVRNPALIGRLTSVEWRPHNSPLDDNPNGGGQRIFPERAVNGSLQNKVDLVFTADTWSTSPRTIYFRVRDPTNYINVAETQPLVVGDNQAAGKFRFPYSIACTAIMDSATLTNTIHRVVMPAYQTTTTLTLEFVEAYAGDNFIVVAGLEHEWRRVATAWLGDGLQCYDVQPNLLDGIKPVHTDMLTVWRTLHIECDFIMYPGMPSLVEMNPASYLIPGSRAETQLARACVVINVMPPNTVQNPNQPTVTGVLNPLSDGKLREIVKARFTEDATPENPKSELDPANTTSGRDLYGNSPDFWTVRIVMLSILEEDAAAGNDHEKTTGAFVPGVNTIVIFFEAIRHEYPSGPLGQTLTNIAIQTILLHEIGHALTNEAHTLTGLMQEYLDAADVLNPENQVFLPETLRKIQYYSRARN